jgi:hypothetical protein
VDASRQWTTQALICVIVMRYTLIRDGGQLPTVIHSE